MPDSLPVAHTSPVVQGFEIPRREYDATFTIHGDGERDYTRDLQVARETHDRVHRWLGNDPALDARRIDAFLCRSAEKQARIERELNVFQFVPSRLVGGFESAGHFPAQQLVLLHEVDHENVHWRISHEFVHHVLEEAAPRLPIALEEGLAEVLPWWILYEPDGWPERTRPQYQEYAREPDRLRGEKRIPRLSAFIALSWEEFQFDRAANFPLAWVLVRLLVTSPDPAIGGRFQSFVRALRTHETPWRAFESTRDAERTACERRLRPAALEYGRDLVRIAPGWDADVEGW